MTRVQAHPAATPYELVMRRQLRFYDSVADGAYAPLSQPYENRPAFFGRGKLDPTSCGRPGEGRRMPIEAVAASLGLTVRSVSARVAAGTLSPHDGRADGERWWWESTIAGRPGSEAGHALVIAEDLG